DHQVDRRSRSWSAKATVAKQQDAFASKIAQQQKQIEALTTGLQKVTARIEAAESAPRVASVREVTAIAVSVGGVGVGVADSLGVGVCSGVLVGSSVSVGLAVGVPTARRAGGKPAKEV